MCLVWFRFCMRNIYGIWAMSLICFDSLEREENREEPKIRNKGWMPISIDMTWHNYWKSRSQPKENSSRYPNNMCVPYTAKLWKWRRQNGTAVATKDTHDCAMMRRWKMGMMIIWSRMTIILSWLSFLCRCHQLFLCALFGYEFPLSLYRFVEDYIHFVDHPTMIVTHATSTRQ